MPFARRYQFNRWFGEAVERDCLPRVLQNFTKVVISTGLTAESAKMVEWIGSEAARNHGNALPIL
jgi:hypothetical protein